VLQHVRHAGYIVLEWCESVQFELWQDSAAVVGRKAEESFDQDFEFPTASQRVQMSPDGQYVIVTGTYPPQVKVYEVAELGIKFERHLDADCVALQVLGTGFEKLVFLQADRTLAFHAAYGMHHAVRVPRFGRDMTYQKATCDLLIACSGPEVYRFNLDEGRYKAPLVLPGSAGANKLCLSSAHQLLAVGTDDGWLHMWDTRSGAGGSKKPVASLRIGSAEDDAEVTALAFATDGLTLGVGTSTAQCLLYDLRSASPLITKEHQYGLPVLDVKFHAHGGEGSGVVLSTDAKIVKAWSRADGAVLANVETPSAINDVCIAHDARGDSGLMMLAGEQARVMAYYVPALGPAPRWCSFLDGLTEELEEKEAATVYDDYKFVTKEEVDSLGIGNLVGTPLLRGYMHGFFMDVQLYSRLKAVSEPFAYETYRKAKLKERIDEKRKSRIAIKQAMPAVNRELAQKLLSKSGVSLLDDVTGAVRDVIQH
jgi:ribosome biogenesis protein ENP2